MRNVDKAYLAGIIDARGSITSKRHLRIIVRQKISREMVAILRELGPGGFELRGNQPEGVFIVKKKRYRIGKRKVVCYEFGIHKTGAIMKTLEPYLRRDLWREQESKRKVWATRISGGKP